MNFTEIFADVPSLVKGIESLIITFETKGNGENKKKAVLDTLGVAYDVANMTTGGSLPFNKNEVLTFADSAINSIVAFKNSIGAFEHKVIDDVKHGVEAVVHDVKETVQNVVQDVKEEVHNIVHPNTQG